MRSKLELAAILLKSLPPATAQRLVRQLKPRELSQVEAEMARIGPVRLADLQSALLQLQRDEQPPLRTGNAPVKEAVLQPAATLDAEGHPFQFLLDGDGALVSKLLSVEHPSLAAKVLSQVPPMIASEWMRPLDPAHRVSIMKRLCDLEPVSDREARQLAASLRNLWNRLCQSQLANEGTLDAAARLLRSAAPDEQAQLLEGIDQSDPGLALRLSAQLVRFDHLRELPDHALRRLLKRVDTSLWAPALKRAEPETRSRILANLAAAPAEILNRELASLSEIDDATARDAQAAIVRVALRMWEEGEIALQIGGKQVTSRHRG